MVQSQFQKLFWNQDCDVVSNLVVEIAIYNFDLFHSTLLHILTSKHLKILDPSHHQQGRSDTTCFKNAHHCTSDDQLLHCTVSNYKSLINLQKVSKCWIRHTPIHTKLLLLHLQWAPLPLPLSCYTSARHRDIFQLNHNHLSGKIYDVFGFLFQIYVLFKYSMYLFAKNLNQFYWRVSSEK